MVYPSGYHLGIPGFRNPVMHPYEVVRESVRLIRQRTQHTAVQVRPWLQDFRSSPSIISRGTSSHSSWRTASCRFRQSSLWSRVATPVCIWLTNQVGIVC